MLRKVCYIISTIGCVTAMSSDQINLTGVVKAKDGTTVSEAIVTLAKKKLKDTTDSKGAFSFSEVTSVQSQTIAGNKGINFSINGQKIQLSTIKKTDNCRISLISASGRKVYDAIYGEQQMRNANPAIPQLQAGIYILKFSSGNQQLIQRVVTTGDQLFLGDIVSTNAESSMLTAKTGAAQIVDTIIASKSGYQTARLTIDSYTKSNVEVVLEPEGTFECTLPKFPDISSLKANKKLPDPFTFFDGTKMTKKSQWPCRRQEILAMAGKYLYGEMPPKPEEVTGTVSGGNISITCKHKGKSASLSFSASGSGEILVITFGGANVKLPSGSRTLNVSQGSMISKIKGLYGTADIGELIAAAWTVDRILDVLELNPTSGINPKKVMVTGCSTNGKAAFVSGVYCDRLALAVPVEGGALAASNLRMTEYFLRGGGKYPCPNSPGKPQGIDNVNDGNWLGSVAGPIRKDPKLVDNLPFDQHLVYACVAPRPIIYVTNYWDWCHLGSTCEALSAYAAKSVWDALGASENFGFNMASQSYSHCMGAQGAHQKVVDEYYKLVFGGDKTANTGVLNIDPGVYQKQEEWPAMWIDWDMKTKLE